MVAMVVGSNITSNLCSHDLVQYTNIIYGYMAFAGFSIFFVLVGIIMLQLLVKFKIPLDAFSFSFMLYNFSVGPCSLIVECQRSIIQQVCIQCMENNPPLRCFMVVKCKHGPLGLLFGKLIVSCLHTSTCPDLSLNSLADKHHLHRGRVSRMQLTLLNLSCFQHVTHQQPSQVDNHKQMQDKTLTRFLSSPPITSKSTLPTQQEVMPS